VRRRERISTQRANILGGSLSPGSGFVKDVIRLD
jgi:hypothetical protein